MLLTVILGNIPIYAAKITITNSDGTTTTLDDFKDTKGHWAQKTIQKWAEYEIVKGTGNGNFSPQANIKRGDLAIIINNFMGLQNIAYNYFNDLPNDSYYRDAVLKAVSEGYLVAGTDNKIRPNDYVTREDMAVILAKMYQIDLSTTGEPNYLDKNSIASWAKPSVYMLQKMGYMVGSNNKFNPKQNLTRAEIITLFNNIADSYIPVRDTVQLGNMFTAVFNNNLVISRSVDLTKSIVNKDVLITQNVKNMTFTSSDIKGTMKILGTVSIDLTDTKIKRLEVHNKVTVSGVNDNILEVYMGKNSVGANLDKIPSKIILEPGVYVRIDGAVYENNTMSLKTYNSTEIKAAIADEKGYVVGGPIVTIGNSFHTMENKLDIKNIQVTKGLNEVVEVGLIYNTGDKVPTLSTNEGKLVYNGTKKTNIDMTSESFTGTKNYRVYVKDSKGLIGYTTPIKLSAYDYNIEIKTYDINYPVNQRVEVIFSGTNIPVINNVRLLFNTSAKYQESQNESGLSLVSNPDDAKVEVGAIKVIRYSTELQTNDIVVDPITGDTTYNPPNIFGYKIDFNTGIGYINKFPVVMNVLPEDIKAVEKLITGNGFFTSSSNLDVRSNTVVSKHVPIQEAGVLYKEVNVGVDPGEAKVEDASWKKKSASVTIGLKSTTTYSVPLTITNLTGETYFVSYVKTGNGYEYGDLKKVSNSWGSSTLGPRIVGNPIINVLSDKDAIIKIPVNLNNRSLDFDKLNTIISFTKTNGGNVNEYHGMSLNSAQPYLTGSKDYIYLRLNKLSANTSYTVTLQLYDTTGEASNIISFILDTSELIDLTLINKVETVDNKTRYNVSLDVLPSDLSKYILVGGTISQFGATILGYTDTNVHTIEITNLLAGTHTITLNMGYYIVNEGGNIIRHDFSRNITITK